MSIRVLITLAFWFLHYTVLSQSLNLRFALANKAIGSEYARAIVPGPDGNVVVLGSFNLPIQLNPATGTVTLTPSGSGSDLYLVNYSANGQFINAFSIPLNDNSTDLLGSVAVDGVGNIYVTGSFRGIVDFDTGPGVATLSAVAGNIFIAKYNAMGQYQWALQVGGTYSVDRGRSIIADSLGNVYVTGQFTSTADFDPGPAVRTLTSGGQNDVFVARYSTDGAYVWAFRIGGYLFDTGEAIHQTREGNIVVTGSFYDTADFNPGTGVANREAIGLSDVFVAQYSADGIYQWALTMGGTRYDDGLSVTSDDENNVYVTGDFTGSMDADPSAAQALLTGPLYVASAFVGKYNKLGAYQWAYTLDGDMYSEVIGRSISAHPQLGVMLTGSFTRKVNLNSIAGVTSFTAAGGRDVFLARYKPDGNLQEAFRLGSTGNDESRGVVLNREGQVFVAGIFAGTVNFSPGSSPVSLTASNQDGFVASYKLLTAVSQCESTRSGDWEDPAIWSCNRVPLKSDIVIVLAGHIVTINSSGATARQIQYRGGQIWFRGQLFIQDSP